MSCWNDAMQLVTEGSGILRNSECGALNPAPGLSTHGPVNQPLVEGDLFFIYFF